jgi:hypothetical protein
MEPRRKTNQNQESARAAFLRGFADAGGLSESEAALRWESFAAEMGEEKRVSLEKGRHALGALCALYYKI